MEFTATLDDQISAPAESAASALTRTGAASSALDAKLRALDVAQQRSARSKEAQLKAFNPDAFKREKMAELDLAAAKEKALQSLGKGLSQKEKEKQSTSGLGAAAKTAALGLAAVAGAGGAMDLAKVAIGYQGMARLQMISQRASLNLRGLFKGVDSKPLERSFSRITGLLDVATPTGKALGGILTRGFNGAFSVLEKAAPYVEGFGQGLVLAALIAEGAFLKLELATLPIQFAIEDATAGIDGMSLASYGAVGVMGLLAAKAIYTGTAMGVQFVGGMASAAASAGRTAIALATRLVPSMVASAGSATAAAAPFLVFAGAVGGAILAYDQFSKLSKEWDSGVLLRSIGIGESDADRMNKQFDAEIAASKAKRAAKGLPPLSRDAKPGEPGGGVQARIEADPNASKALGMRSGEEMGAGLVAGLVSSYPAVSAAGAGLAAAADRGVRDASEINSPSRLFRKEAMYMGEGVEQGLEASAPGVQKAAERSLIPETPGRAGGSSGGQQGGGAPTFHFDFSGATFGGSVNAGDVRAQVEEAMAMIVQMLAARLGVA